MLVFLTITATALCKALCLLWYRKFDIPSYAKPIMLEAIPPNTEANIAPLLCPWSVRNLGSIFPMSLVFSVKDLCDALCENQH